MSKYTIKDVGHIIPVEQTGTVIQAIEKYLNEGVIPPFDPCYSCEPNHIRKLISLIQTAERTGLWPPKRTDEGYTAGEISDEEKVELTEVAAKKTSTPRGKK